MIESDLSNIHQNSPLHTSGTPLDQASAALILLHGRGASAQEILFLGELLDLPGFAVLAPQATGNTWYPQRFMTPIAGNQPWLDSALRLVADLIAYIQNAGIPKERVVLGGFSQGACLASEFVVRNARRYGGLLAFSGGLIGPPGTEWSYPGSLEGTPAFLGCSDRDPHIPLERVHETAGVLARYGADVSTKIYPNLAHTVHPDEIERARELLAYLI